MSVGLTLCLQRTVIGYWLLVNVISGWCTFERNEITLTAEPTDESANESLVIVGTPSETSETADAKTATPKKPAAKKPAKKPTKKPTKKPAKKKTGKTLNWTENGGNTAYNLKFTKV